MFSNRFNNLVQYHVYRTMKLPSWTQSEIDRKIAQDGCVLIIANRFVYDVTDFLSTHPGEEEIIRQKSGGGQDCTADYNFHGSKARKLWAKYRVARFKERKSQENRSRGIFGCAIA